MPYAPPIRMSTIAFPLVVQCEEGRSMRAWRPDARRATAGWSGLVETLPALYLYYAVAVKGGGGVEGCATT